jgi:hypothetical protein
VVIDVGEDGAVAARLGDTDEHAVRHEDLDGLLSPLQVESDVGLETDRTIFR